MKAVKVPDAIKKQPPQDQAYLAISKVTGLPVIMSPPGTPPITSAQVREMLRNFP